MVALNGRFFHKFGLTGYRQVILDVRILHARPDAVLYLRPIRSEGKVAQPARRR